MTGDIIDNVITGEYSSGRGFGGDKILASPISKKNKFVTEKDMLFCENVFYRADAIRKGNNFIIGNHFDTFMEFWNNMEIYEQKRIEQQLVFVEARNVEGVFLSDEEIADPNMFWSHKNLGEYSRESMFETTQYLPEIFVRLNNGENIDSIMDDERLGECAISYFSSPIRVSKLHDTYVFCRDGRHRVIAAQSLGCIIPAYVESIIEKI